MPDKSDGEIIPSSSVVRSETGAGSPSALPPRDEQNTSEVSTRNTWRRFTETELTDEAEPWDYDGYIDWVIGRTQFYMERGYWP